MNNSKDIHEALLERVARKYEKDGYKVYIRPEISVLPFDLGSYRPDLLAVKSENEGYIIGIKNRTAYTSVDRFREIAETVARHDGWRFLLVTGDDILPNEPYYKTENILLSREQISARKEKAERLLSLGQTEGAFLTFWGVAEAVMRRQAEQASIPIERFPTSSLIKHLYSQGELSVEQFDKAMELLNIRNQFIHGFQSQNSEHAVRELQKLVSELSEAWYPNSQN